MFIFNGQIVHWFNYWEEGKYGDLVPPLAKFEHLARIANSHFITLDIAQTTNNEWLVVELGDATWDSQ